MYLERQLLHEHIADRSKPQVQNEESRAPCIAQLKLALYEIYYSLPH